MSATLHKKLMRGAARRWDSIAAFLFAAVSWSWLPFVEVSQLADPPIVGRVLSFLGYLIMCLISAWFFRLALRWFTRYYRSPDFSPVWFVVVVFFVWAAMELFVSWIVTVIWIGSGGSVDSVLPFASFTPLLMYTPLGLLSRFLGYHGVSAAFVTLVAVLALSKTRPYVVHLAVCLVVLCVVSRGLYSEPNGTNVSVQIAAEELYERNDAMESSAELVVFPEYGLDDIKTDTTDDRVRSADGSEVFFVGSQQHADNIKVGNYLVFGSTKQGFITTAAKRRLVPAGEYIPYTIEVPLRLFGANHTIQKFLINRAVAKGSETPSPVTVRDGVVVGVGVCASITSPSDYRVFAREGSTMLANIASLEIFRSPVFDVQHEGMARFMAVANARPFVQSANAAPAFALDHNGRVIYRTDPVSSGSVDITTNQRLTPYTYLGEWPAIVGGLAIAVSLVRKRLSSKKRQPR